MLEIRYCKERKARLLNYLQAERLACAVLSSAKTIYYLTGALVDPLLPHAFVMDDAGRSLFATNRDPSQAAADEVRTYTGYTIERVFSRSTMQAEIDSAVHEFAGAVSQRPVAIETEWTPQSLAAQFTGPVRNLSEYLNDARRVKDPDEIACMRETVRITEAGYAAIKAALAPGMTECQAYNIVQEAIVNAAGTSVYLRGDFACGNRAIGAGGPPTSRKIEAGELYIFDLFPIFHGYMCDLCRTFVVGGRASAQQQEVWAHVMAAHQIAARAIRPGARGREVYAAIREHVEQIAELRGSFTHHAGHSIGMEGWEFPWLTPGSDQEIQAGNVIACEPALYGEAIRGGIRLEHNYLVREEGVEALDSFPMEL
jgi:Xaa-Pro aminopeptidase